MATVRYGQNGYIGSSMSVRAMEAYESGEMPRSKWTKQAILDCYSEKMQKELKKFNLETLRNNCLRYSSWHHTGKMLNETDFYEAIAEEEIDPASFIIAEQPKKKPGKTEWVIVDYWKNENRGTARWSKWVTVHSVKLATLKEGAKKARIESIGWDNGTMISNFSVLRSLGTEKPRKNAKVLKEFEVGKTYEVKGYNA